MPDDAEVSNDLWDEVIEGMKVRVRDKIHLVRTFAVRALSRFVNDSSNIDILDLFLEMLPLEQNAVSVPIGSINFVSFLNSPMPVSTVLFSVYRNTVYSF